MLGFFRSFLKSRIGVAVALVFLGLIALAFASADVTGSGFGGVAGGDRAAKVGSARVDTSELGKALTNAFEQERQKQPGMTMKDFLAAGGMETVLTGLTDRLAMAEWARKHGVVAGDRLIDSEIVKIPAFQGPDGKFSQSAYEQLLAQRGLTDKQVRKDIGQGLIARQLLLPAAFGAQMADEAVQRYAALLTEKRIGTIVSVPSLAFAPASPPDAATLTAYYNANKRRYMQPERRTIRYAIVDEASLKTVPAPTEAEIAQRYKLNTAIYAPSEQRSVTQVIVPTEAAAKALASEVGATGSLDNAARTKGLVASKLADQTRDTLTNQTSRAVADAAFAAASGTLAAPAKSGLGWHVVKVDAIKRNPGKTLDQARPEIVAAITLEKRRAALSDLAAQVEQEIDNGTGLADIAKTLNLTIASTPALTADGSVFGKQGEKASADIAPLVQAAFAMEREGEAQLAEIKPGEKFAIYDVGQLTAATPAPLDLIKGAVARDWAVQQGSAKAKAATDKILAALNKGTPLAEAMKLAGVALPAPQPVDLPRQALTQMQGKVPAPLALMFAMAKGSNKPLEGPNNGGWYVVSLKEIVLGKVERNDAIFKQATASFAQDAGGELADQLRIAIRNDVGVERNEAGIKAVRDQLTGANAQ
ncbi:peptidylprolyl isomerase [Novosphingobium taihuense]|uniref:Parvulin-like PPIase n=1 Tax=Novosphingobium taihuense TaxID=260085 RepID=A0A7W7AGJ7_9SPHN|nr:peptidylprolyl isomerase [Novosphingobium taihuense]MBB4615612.1 peptidyl-prolyl cis-trans isomerase D [Novosphingobium taihuense]TWH82902.1 peptidyl-prolyl cis-trans isomerase D [Novosphingobium taihuense]